MHASHRQEEKNRIPIHDRVIEPCGRRASGPKSRRSGFPALFLGSSAVTKTLVEIAALEPIAVKDLPERRNVTDANLGYTVRRLIRLGLVQRFKNPIHRDRYLLTLDGRHPHAGLIQDLLRVIARANHMRWSPTIRSAKAEQVLESDNVTTLRLFGSGPEEMLTLLGHPHRTHALLLIGILKALDPSSLARVVGVRTDGDMHRLLDSIEADGIVVSKMVGSIRLYELRQAPWTTRLRALLLAVVQGDRRLADDVAVARTLMLAGGFSNRTHLRRVLGFENDVD